MANTPSSLRSFTKTGIGQVTARESFVCAELNYPIYCFFFSCDELEFQGMENDGDLCKPGDVLGIIEGAVPQI